MPVVDVRVVRMTVSQRRVGMLVNVGPGAVPPVGVFMAMMLVVSVRVRVHEGLVPVFVSVMFRDVQPHAEPHQRGRGDQGPCHGVLARQDRHDGPEERCYRKVGARARRPEMTQREDE